MSGLMRRPSGIYVARLAVPARLRAAVGKRELLASTGSRLLAIARVVAAEQLAAWRRQLYDLDRHRMEINAHQLITGSPVLAGDGTIPLSVAAQASGIDSAGLLRYASEGTLKLYARLSGVFGHTLPISSLEIFRTASGDELLVPGSAREMPDEAASTIFSGLVSLRESDAFANRLLSDDQALAVLFDVPNAPGTGFAPEKPFVLRAAHIELSKKAVEAVRARIASSVTPEQLRGAERAATTPNPTGHGSMRWSVAIAKYMRFKAEHVREEHAVRIGRDLALFGELMADPVIAKIDRDLVRRYLEHELPRVPMDENRVRIKFGTKSIVESIRAIAGSSWPTLSGDEVGRRITAVVAMLKWAAGEGWIERNPAEGLASQRSKERKKSSEVQAFDQHDLAQIFEKQWFALGRGELTKAGTYRTFLPYRYWLPLMALYTGGRINELAQLRVADIRVSKRGVHFIDINDLEDKDTVPTGSGKRLKNRNSLRTLPIHPHLLELGLVAWKNKVHADGHVRLFPELREDRIKGPSKDAVKWFSGELQKLGWARDRTKVFHSFRHTLITHCVNDLRLPETVVAQLSGHERGKSVLMRVYRKDELPDELMEMTSRIMFVLPPIAAFDLDAGLHSLRDALARKARRSPRAG